MTLHHYRNKMCSSSSSISTIFPLHFPRRNHLFLKFSNSFPIATDEAVFKPTNPRKQKLISLSASITKNNLEVSWVSSDRNDVDDYNGWGILEETVSPKTPKKGYVLRISSPFHVLVDKKSLGSEELSKVGEAVNEPLIENVNEEAGVTAEEVINSVKWEVKPGRVVISVSADATQQEALSWLKNLKIIEDEVKADELCTRKEYARWLVQLNTRLERNPRKRIVPSVALAGSTFNAFDDVSDEDPDFEYIQALAEAGVVVSKLSATNTNADMDSSKSFYPERLICREDLVGWRAKIEYEVIPGLSEEILRNKIGFLDARELKSDVLQVLFMDSLADDTSIMRKVFGQVKRFQPGKPCTKAQAAVALTSGRIAESIYCEFSKIEAENSSRELAMRELKTELLERGDIQRFWEKKLADENSHLLEVEAAYLEALKDLEHQKIDHDNSVAAYLKEKAALDCQKQLLYSLKEEVEEMNKRLADERADYVGEQHKIHSNVSELEVNFEKVLDSKSILEAELEALRKLRSWIEDKAKKGQARTKVLEEAGRRWKWGSRS